MKRLLSVVVMILFVAGTWWVAGAQNRGGRGAHAPARQRRARAPGHAGGTRHRGRSLCQQRGRRAR